MNKNSILRRHARLFSLVAITFSSIGLFLFWFLSFSSVWEEPAAYEDDISRIRFEFGNRIGRSYIDITDRELVRFLTGRLQGSRSGVGDQRISLCRVRLYDSSGIRSAYRPAWLYGDPFGIHVITNVSAENYEYFSFGEEIPARLSEAFGQIAAHIEKEGVWSHSSRIRIHLEEGFEGIHLK